MENKLTVFFYGMTEESKENTQKTVESDERFEWVGNADNVDDAIKKVTFIKPNILMIEISDVSAIETTANIISLIKSKGFKPYTVLLIKKGMTYNMKKLLQEGASDFVYLSLNAQTLSQIYETYKNAQLKSDPFLASKKNIGETKVISFFSPKGGVGKTFLALNVAAGLAGFIKKRVLYLDLSFPYSDVPILLDVSTNNKNLYDLMIFLEENPEKSPKEYILEIEDLGFSLVLPPRSLIETAHILSNLPELKQIIQILRTYFDWTVIDLPPKYYDFLPIIFQVADENFAVITAEGESAVLLQQFKEEMMAQGVSMNFKTILNRNNPKVHQIIGKEWRVLAPDGMFTSIADDPLEAGVASNSGELTIARNTKSLLKKDLLKLVKLITQV